MTLAFLGQRPDPDAGTVAGVLERLDAPSPATALGDALLLPPRRARVLAVALAGDALAALQAEVAGALAAAGLYEPEARRFRPHVTVARLRSGARAPRSVAAAPEPVAFAAGPVVLYRSHLGRGGAAYEPLFVRALG